MRRRKSSRAPRSRRLKRQGKGSHSKARRPSLIREQDAGRDASRGTRPTGPETSTSRSAAGRPSRPGAIASQIALRVRCSAAESPGGRCQPGAAGAVDAAGQRPEPERQQRQEAVDEEVEQVDEDVLVEEVEAERAERGGGLAGGQHEQQRPVADDVGLGDEADAGDHDHVGEGERQPELLLGVRGAGEVAERSRRGRRSTSRTPLGTAMKRMPTTAKLTASRRRLRTTNFSAVSPRIPARTLTGRARLESPP